MERRKKMTLEERFYRTLVVSSSEKFNEYIVPLLTNAHCEPVVYVNSIAAAKRSCLEKQYDFVIINGPLPDEPGLKFAIDISSGKSTVCLLFIKSELYAETRSKVTPCGVFTLQKPTSAIAVAHGLDFLASARERLRNLEKKSLSLEEKMEEIRIVNRAKWLLIDNLKMTESDAHRYIEKLAMDTCVTKGEAAKSIISTYA